jgi:hypothetical protein
VIADKDIEVVFDSSVVAELAKCIKAPADANLVRFGDDIRAAARAYLAEYARTDWKAIAAQIRDLYRYADKAERGADEAAVRLADYLGSINLSTRQWLERCALRPIPFPTPVEIIDKQTRQQAVQRLRRIVSYGLQPANGRLRPSGKRSRSNKPILRAPVVGRGGVRDLAARGFVQHLALAYLEVTGRSAPRRVNLHTPGPFLRLVQKCFQRTKIPAGYVVDLINERENLRKEMAMRQTVADQSLRS